MTDPRKIVGSVVYARASMVTSDAECARRYGANWKIKVVKGTVLSATPKQAEGERSRKNWFIRAKYELSPGCYKVAELNLRSVYRENKQEMENFAIQAGASSRPPAVPTRTETVSVQPPPSTNTPRTDACIALPFSLPPQDPPQVSTEPPRQQVQQQQQQRNVEEEPMVHGYRWKADETGVRIPCNGPVNMRNWSMRTAIGNSLGPKGDTARTMSRLDYFLLMFPPEQLHQMVILTNEQMYLKSPPLKPISQGELLKFFGVCILATRFEFLNRHDLWSTTSLSKYEPAYKFGLTRMSRNRFDQIWSNLRFSSQPREKPDYMSSEQYRWRLVDDFVTRFNLYRANNFSPSDLICVDESISRWYGQGGYWINIGLPQYVAIDRKPENGCEIQNAACGRSGIMMQLKIVKTAEEEGSHTRPDETGLPHGTAVLKGLVLPWSNTNRVVCADSYFASVTTAEELHKIGLRFIGVVKTATRKFPMACLSRKELTNRGDRFALIHKGREHQEGENHHCFDLLAYVWMERDRRYFIASAGSMQEGVPYSRIRWRQTDEENKDADPERVQLVVPQPVACEMYYEACGKIDQHNQMRQDDLQLEKKLVTHDWSMRVGLSLIGICIVDTWLAYKECTGTEERQKEFYSKLAEELIDNNYDGVGGSGSGRSSAFSTETAETGLGAIASLGVPRRRLYSEIKSTDTSITLQSGYYTRLTPTKKRQKKNSTFRCQGRCGECGLKTIHVCSECLEFCQTSKERFLCHTRSGRRCFNDHCVKEHGVSSTF